MTYLTGIVLGTVQGLTEFLPISSSGHLIIARELFGFSTDNGLAYDAILQLGTILAVTIYFRRDLWKLAQTFWRIINQKAVEATDKTLLLAILFGTFPALVLGFALEGFMETTFRSAGLVAIMLIIGSVLMWGAERYHEATHPFKHGPLSVKKGFWVGCFQVLALIPGMSRSGVTISGGLLLDLPREAAARFSFLLSFPIIVGTGLKKLLDLESAQTLSTMGGELLVGLTFSFLVGYACIGGLLQFLRTYTLRTFIWYRIIVAFGVLGFLFAK